jgi:hypothetical protein
MTTTAPDPIADFTPRGSSAVLDRAAAALAARREADVALLAAAVEWAELHPAASLEDAAGWGEPDLYGEGCSTLAGEGAPLVAEFAPLELAAVLGWTPIAVQQLMGDALELKHRLPRLWRLVTELVVPVHLARHVAELTRDLPWEAARDADRAVSTDPDRMSRTRIRRLVDEARLYHDPDRAIDDEQQALAARKVELFPGNTPATTDVFMRLDTPDADAFNTSVAAVAELLGKLGDADPLDVRRSRAVGVLADPQRALDLLTREVDSGPKVTTPAALWLHVTDTTLLDLDMTAGGVISDRLGVLSTDLLKAWLTDSTVIVNPVLDLDRLDAVDGHDPPPWMADLVSSATRPASSRGVAARPGPATSTTSTPTSRSTRVVHPTRRDRRISRHSAGDITARRRTAGGAINGGRTAAVAGARPRGAPSRCRRSADGIGELVGVAAVVDGQRQRPVDAGELTSAGPRNDVVAELLVAVSHHAELLERQRARPAVQSALDDLHRDVAGGAVRGIAGREHQPVPLAREVTSPGLGDAETADAVLGLLRGQGHLEGAVRCRAHGHQPVRRGRRSRLRRDRARSPRHGPARRTPSPGTRSCRGR